MITIEDLSQPQFGLVASWLSEPDINRWLTSEWRGRTVDATLVAIMVRNKRNRSFLVRRDGQPVAFTALADFDREDATAMIWYFMGEPELSGRGIVSEAVKQTAAKCFHELGLESIYAWAMEDNAASIRVLQKAGFRNAGRIRCAAFSNGRQVDRVYFDLVARECPVSVTNE